jgi:hypothetical protein
MDGSFQPKDACGSAQPGLLAAGTHAKSASHRTRRGDGHASHCRSVRAGCLFQHQHCSASPANERLQIMPRVPAGVCEKSYARRLQQRVRHLHEVLPEEIAVERDADSYSRLDSSLCCFSDDPRAVMFADNGFGGVLQRHPIRYSRSDWGTGK